MKKYYFDVDEPSLYSIIPEIGEILEDGNSYCCSKCGWNGKQKVLDVVAISAHNLNIKLKCCKCSYVFIRGSDLLNGYNAYDEVEKYSKKKKGWW